MSRRFLRMLAGLAAPAVLVLAAVGRPVPAAAAAVLDVPGGFATIQSAIDAAAAGDTVRVAPGVYHEHIDFKGKAITVQSAQGPGSTVIDGSALDRVVIFHTSETLASVLQGFTIQNGLTTSGTNGYDGAGIGISFASPTIQGNVITNNVSGGDGAGIDVYHGSPAILGNTITGNTKAQGWTGQGGGGIALGGAESTNAQVIGNTITHNHSYWGGAMMLNAAGSPTISDNLMSDNSSESDGGAIWSINASSPLMVQNVIVANQSPTLGGGIFFGSGTLVNNTIADNTSTEGGALYGVGSAQLYNNILQSRGATAVECSTGSTPLLDHNDAFGSGSAGFDGACASAAGTNGNISADPLFAGAGNYHLATGSPAIDAGDNAAPSLPAADFDGNPRISGGAVDMGAYESVPGSTPPPPATGHASLSPSSLTFASVRVGKRSSASITVANSGSGDLHVSAISIQGSNPSDFAVPSNTCSGAVVPGGACSITVVFSPTAAGARTATLTVQSDDPAGPATAALSGTGR